MFIYNKLKSILDELKYEQACDVLDNVIEDCTGKGICGEQMIYWGALKKETLEYAKKMGTPALNEYLIKKVEKMRKECPNRTIVINSSLFCSLIKISMRNSHKIVTLDNMERTKSINVLNYYLDFFRKDNNVVLANIDVLLSVLEQSNLNNRLIIEIILEVLRKNAKRMGEYNHRYLDLNVINNQHFKYLSDKMRDRIVSFCDIEQILKIAATAPKKVREEVNTLLESRESEKEFAHNIDCILGFFNGIESYQEDSDGLKRSLENLGLGSYFYTFMTAFRKTEKRKEEILDEKMPEQAERIQGADIDIESGITDKEVKSLWHEVNEYFDFNNMKTYRELSLEEIIKVLVILNKLQVPQDIISKFLLITRRLMVNSHPIALYFSLYDKIQFYMDNEIVRFNVELIEDCLNEGCLFKNDDDYSDYKELIRIAVNEIVREIGTDYSYEEQKRLELVG